MTESTTLLSLTQLVDVSLNCHEGLVNFHSLHTLLHVLIQQLNLGDVGVEFRGPDSGRMQALIAGINTSGQPFLEYGVIGGQKSRRRSKRAVSLQDIKEQQNVEEKKEKELRVIERRKDSKEDPALNPLPLKSPPGSLTGLKAGEQQLSTVVLVESQSRLPQFSVAVSKSAFDELQEDVSAIKHQIKELTEMPGNMGLIEATRTGSSPILDMFQILTLIKRMDAAETAMEKLHSLMEEIVRQTGDADFAEKAKAVRQSVDFVTPPANLDNLNNLESRVVQLENFVKEINANLGGQKPSPSPGDESDKVKIWDPKKMYNSVIRGVNLSEQTPEEAIGLLQQEFQNLSTWIESSIKEVDSIKAGAIDLGDVDLGALQGKFDESAKQVEELDKLYTQQIGLLNTQLGELQKEMNDVVTKIDVILPGGDSTGINAETTMELANKLVLLEKEIITISDNAAKLQTEKEESDKNMEAILEQIDVLKIVKANREDLEDALGDKADACQINRKVSHDQFDAACDDLSRGIEEALTKLQEQEEMWHQALESIQKDVGNKLDRMEVDPLRDFVNAKLKALQEKFKSLTALKREQEAAGTKSKFLKNVNCISCDKDVVMRKEMDPTLKPRPYAMPPSRNMAPYLAYELDQLRKQQKCVPGSKNMNFFESALKAKTVKDKDHLCNRYCGGSHTVTTPQQRVTRLGHFLEQWGPEIAPLNDEYVRGKDNHMYKARDENIYQKMLSKQNEMAANANLASKVDDAVSKDAVAPQTNRQIFTNQGLAQRVQLQSKREESPEYPKAKVQEYLNLKKNLELLNLRKDLELLKLRKGLKRLNLMTR
ncbi:intracellular protein transport protein USO1-like [Asbolus verrucosus]|uniref:Intracellular protein transport protein USO1-like n=1 Tax=Asbolus verrucosus TaxID=1661398 RepID=A0A482VKS9_ASBVE|nr:intracellular protein transport protein USO1-like [Asbolus verrucosus]